VLKTQVDNVVVFPGDLSDHSVASFRQRVSAVLQNRSSDLIIDCSRLEHVISSQVNLLWQAYQMCLDAGVELRLAKASPGLVRVLKALDLYDLFQDQEKTQRIERCQVIDTAGMAGPKEYLDVFRASASGVEEAMERYLRFLDSIGIPGMLKFELRTVFYEIATNIRTHSGLHETDNIRVSANSNRSRIVLTFEDNGMPFDLTAQPAGLDIKSAANHGRKRGFGITMINRLTDHLSYTRKNGSTNVLTIEKLWSL
jgi:anti-anti-sigma factor